MTVEMFPDSELLTKKRPDSPTPFDSHDRYKTASTQESALLDELYVHFPERVHRAMQSVYFKDLVRDTFFCSSYYLIYSITVAGK